MFLDKKGYSVKCKHRMRDSVTNRVGIQQFICLIGGGGGGAPPPPAPEIKNTNKK